MRITALFVLVLKEPADDDPVIGVGRDKSSGAAVRAAERARPANVVDSVSSAVNGQCHWNNAPPYGHELSEW